MTKTTTTDPELPDHAATTLTATRHIIDSNESIDTVLWALARHGVAVWQLGQHSPAYDWFCTLSHKAAWGDVFYKAEHCATLDAAVRQAAKEWSDTR